MASSARQVPLPEVLTITPGTDGVYRQAFPSSVCYGQTISGGAVLSWVFNAALDFISNQKSAKDQGHNEVTNYSFNFLRPTFCAPREVVVRFDLTSSGALSTIVHTEVTQKDKKCMVGYLTLSSFKPLPGRITQRHSWHLSPSSPPAPSFAGLENDTEEKWLVYHVPYEGNHVNQAQSYIKCAVPLEQTTPAIMDAWVAPGWVDPSGIPVWTNETVHYLLDSAFPPMYSLADTDLLRPLSPYIVKAAQQQRYARRKGQSDAIVGEGLGAGDTPAAVTTATLTTEMKQRLPEEGVRWLFMRNTTKRLLNSRADHSIDLLDANGNVIAIAQHAMIAIPLDRKLAERKEKL